METSGFDTSRQRADRCLPITAVVDVRPPVGKISATHRPDYAFAEVGTPTVRTKKKPASTPA